MRSVRLAPALWIAGPAGPASAEALAPDAAAVLAMPALLIAAVTALVGGAVVVLLLSPRRAPRFGRLSGEVDVSRWRAFGDHSR